MKNLWLAFVVLATLGSLYPFNFTLAALSPNDLSAFLASCCRMSGRGDMVANIILFVPFGLLGMLVLERSKTRASRIVLLTVIGATFALVLQLAQIFLPSRDENLQDVLWNTVGVLFGAAMAMLIERLSPPAMRGQDDISIVPLSLIGAWLTYRLMPFVPSLDWQSIKNSLKPLVTSSPSWTGVVTDATGWLVVGYLLYRANGLIRLDAWLLPLIGAVLALEVLVVFNVVDRSDIIGALFGFVAWVFVSRSQNKEMVLLAIVVAMTVVTGLAPFMLRDSPASFSWIPFHGFLAGSMFANAQAAAFKVFIYGTLVYLLAALSVRRSIGVLITCGLVFLIELSQMFLVQRTPEVTDPLLVVLAGAALIAVDRQAQRSVPVAAADRAQGPAELTGPGFATGSEWVAHSVNLIVRHADLLDRLAGELGGTRSQAVRHIVADFLEEMDLTDGVPPQTTLDVKQRTAVHPDWVTLRVNLRRDQFNTLVHMAEEAETTVSSIIRRIVRRFLRPVLDDDA